MRNLVAALFLIPALVLNAGGRVLQMWTTGKVEIEPLASVLFIVASIALLGFCGIAIAKSETRASRFWIGVVGVVFVVVNFILALDVVSHSRDTTSDPRKHTIQQAANLQNDLKRARQERADLKQPETWATAESIDAAKSAVQSAETARAQECGKVGDNCRTRVRELSERQLELGKLMAAKTATDMIIAADDKITAISSEISGLGVVPTHADPGSARMARLTTLSEATMAELLPLIFAACFELLALVGPHIAMIALGEPRRPRATQEPVQAAPVVVESKPVEVAPEPVRVNLAPSVPSRPRPKLATSNKLPTGAVLDFLGEGVNFTAGPETEMTDTFIAYSAWCSSSGLRPMGVDRFVPEIERSCKQFGISIREDGDRHYLVNVQLMSLDHKVVKT